MATWSVPVTVVTPTIYDPLISDNDDVKPDITAKSPLLKLWLFVGVIRRVSLSSFVMTASLYFNTSVTILVIGSPLIESTFAIIPSPSVPSLLNFNISPTFWLVPPSIISIEFTEPDSTVWISIFWVCKSLASVKKSFPAVFSDTL